MILLPLLSSQPSENSLPRVVGRCLLCDCFPGDDHFYTGSEAGALVGEFLQVLVVSALLGAAFGLLCSFLLKRLSNVQSSEGEIAFLFIGAYVSYMTSEILDMSGGVTIFVCAVVMAHYSFFSIGPPAQVTTAHFSNNLAFIAEKFIYCYIGMNFLALHERYGRWADPKFIAVSIAVGMLARALTLFPLAAVANLWRSEKLTLRELVRPCLCPPTCGRWPCGSQVSYVARLHLP